MRLAHIAWCLAVVGLAGCGGGGGSTTGGAHGTLVPPAQSVSTGTPAPSSATSTATYTSAGATIAFPSAGGYSGTIKLPVSGMLGVATMTLTSSTGPPSGVPTYLDRRRASGARHILSSVIAPQFYETLNSSDSVVFNSFPVMSFTVPSTINTSTTAFYVASYDPTLGAPWVDLGRTGLPYHQTVSIGVNGTTLAMQGNVNYTYALYSFPLEVPTSTFAASPCPTPAVAAVSSNDILWCAAGSGFEKITPSGSSFVSLPNTAYTVEGMTRGPDGNAWFTAQSTSQSAGRLPLYGKIDETSGAVTTYEVPNPSSYPTSAIEYTIGSIAAGPSALYFVTNAGTSVTQGFVETADTSGNVTQHVQLTYRLPTAGFGALAYGSDGNAWLVAEPSSGAIQLYVTKVTLSGGTTTNYQAPVCSLTWPANLVQGGDGTFYVPGFGGTGTRGLCNITLAGVTTFTPVSPFLQPIFDLTVASDGSVWYAVPKGVGRVSGGTITQYSDPALHDVSQGVFALPNGTLWEIGTFPSAESVQVLNVSSP